MRFKLLFVFLLGALLPISGGPAFAHRSLAAEFDQDKPIAITGTLTIVDRIDPHVYTYLGVKARCTLRSRWYV